MFTPRPYQQEAIDHGIDFFESSKKFNAFQILPTGSGKSVVIANIAMKTEGDAIVLQPSKEILAQNLQKFVSYGYRASVYSASAGSKHVDKITFCTPGSIVKKLHLFKGVKHIIVDECDLVNADAGMYQTIIKGLPEAKTLGVTATPYRLESGFEGAQLKFINRTNPRIFNKMIYAIQNDTLFDAGYLSKLEYYSFDVINRSMIELNSTGTDFSDTSLKEYYKKIDMPRQIADIANQILETRKNLLVFCSLVKEAYEVANMIPGSVVVESNTPDAQRDSILMRFKRGIVRCVINVGILTVGFDKPDLEALLIGRSTMSLRLWYQMIGRGMRIHEEKENCWVVDLGDNLRLFGKIETMRLRQTDTGLLSYWNNGRQLTNVPFRKN